jgi:hypothetical protein
MKHSPALFLFLLFSFTLPAQQTVGVFQNDPPAFQGLTLLMPSSYSHTYLIDNCGREVHSWESDYPPGLSAYLLESGQLLRTARIPGAFFGGGVGGRIELFNWEGELEWGYNYASDNHHQHHDVEYLPNGNILVLAWEKVSATEAVQAGRDPDLTGANGVYTETIVELQAVGTNQAVIIWKWNLWDHLVQEYDPTKDNYGLIAEHPERIDVNYQSGLGGPGGNNTDWVHINSIDYNPALDQIILSSRDFSEFWVIDHSTTTAEAAGHSGGNSGMGGDILYRWGNPQAYDRGTPADQKLYAQHDAHWIPDGLPDAGKIMVFNNGIGRLGEDYSSVEVINPPLDANGKYILEPAQAYGPAESDWIYTSPPPLISFFSNRISGAQRLPNGNTLICEGVKGQIFEVTPDKEIVWRYISPVVNFGPISQGDTPGNNDLFRAYRYGADYSAFDNKSLIPGAPLELAPLPSDCVTDTLISSSTSVFATAASLTIFPNPVRDHLTIEQKEEQRIFIEVFDGNGKRFLQKESHSRQSIIDTQNWPKGLYFIRVLDEAYRSLFSEKVLRH